MKKRILIIGVVLALILTLIAPAAAFAKPYGTWTEFYADAQMVVTGPGLVNLSYIGQGKMLMTTSGEVIEGIFTNSDWDEAENAYLYVSHNSQVILYPNGMFYGQSDDDVYVTFTNKKTLTGTSQTDIVGRWSWEWDKKTRERYISCEWVKDSGYFNISSVKTYANGSWNAVFYPVTINGNDTLAGEAQFTGCYYSRK